MTRLWRLRVLRSLALLLLLLGAYAGLHALAENVADSVSVTMRASEGVDSAGTIVFSRTTQDVQTAQQAQAAVNSTRLVNPLDSYPCALGPTHPLYRYHIEFRLHGLLVEVADVDTSGCEWWSITALGMPPGVQRQEPYPSRVLPTLHQLTGMPIPQP